MVPGIEGLKQETVGTQFKSVHGSEAADEHLIVVQVSPI